MSVNYFIPDRDERREATILRGHLPPVAENVAREYIEHYSEQGDIIVDPFAHAPGVARAAYETGRRAIAVEANPLAAFVARIEANPPPARLIDDALKTLNETPKDELLLGDHLDGLYATNCMACGERVIADAFVYSSELGVPVEKIYRCVRDGARHDPTTDAERTQAGAFEKRGFHYHFVWNRVSDALGGDVQANNLRTGLAHYAPRSLYALVTLWLKLDSVLENHPARDAMLACFIHALDRGSLLYPPDDEFPARKIPLLVLEPNIWRTFTNAAQGFKSHASIRLVDNVETLVAFREPGAYIGRGSSRQLASDVEMETQVALVLTSPPPLAPVFWILSYLWARWIWGRNSREAEALEPFLDSERHRWSWYGDALTTALQATSKLLRPEARVIFAFPSGSHAVIEALALAASAGRLDLETYIFRPMQGARTTSEFGALRGDYRVVFRSPGVAATQTRAVDTSGTGLLGRRLRDEALVGARAILEERGEPLPYAWLHQRALAQVTRSHLVDQLIDAKFARYENAYQFLHRELTTGIKDGYAEELDHWKDNSRVLWFQREARPDSEPPLTEQVEDVVRGLFSRVSQLSASALDDAVLSTLNEWRTPEPELVQAAAQAYAELRNGTWHARTTDIEAEAARTTKLLAELGEQMGFEMRTDHGPFVAEWWDEKLVPASNSGNLEEMRVREPSHAFSFASRASFREFVARRVAPLEGLVLVRESFVPLIREMSWRMPILAKLFYDEGWNFLRVKILEDALGHEGLERRHWRALVGLDPAIEKGREQLELF